MDDDIDLDLTGSQPVWKEQLVPPIEITVIKKPSEIDNFCFKSLVSTFTLNTRIPYNHMLCEPAIKLSKKDRHGDSKIYKFSLDFCKTRKHTFRFNYA